MSIPVVDFGAYSLSEKDVPDEQMQNLSEQLKTAFTEIGFVFLKNTGITEEEVNRVMDISKKFFLQPDELKQPFSRKSFSNNPNHGWVSLETERLNPSRPGDLKEAFNTSSFHPDIKWPSGAVTGFQEIQASFYQRCKELSLRVLRVMAHSLGLDPEVFLSAHRSIGTDENGSTLRSLYYPSVNCEKAKQGQLRCGEHSDYGSITLLFQSSEGLQVRRRSGEFICPPAIPGAVLINIADLMQRWTSDQFVSVRHRVLLPPAGDSSTRQSLAFFVQPDDEALITCCDGSNKYPPVTAGTYLNERFNYSYGRN
ncbi:2-oxoglutarate-dependent dioxygenase gloF-like [Micropterus salmoides]|uniref:2-oxoglutarate-dependent dioxygenase gloF-like n=1 Tax=Micropterus salmoides TaxID=27706 RepID=UPI0018ED1540|nr:2-oxoglutarate-dependent dioxygenase gloF-like [Micropterus salmoides]